MKKITIVSEDIKIKNKKNKRYIEGKFYLSNKDVIDFTFDENGCWIQSGGCKENLWITANRLNEIQMMNY